MDRALKNNRIFFLFWLLTCTAALLFFLTGPVNATKLACKAGIKETVFAEARIRVSRSGQKKFEQKLEAWGQRNGYSIGSVASEDPYTKPPTTTWTSFLQSKRSGIVLEAAGSNRNNSVKLSVRNNCWADQEGWKPHWRKLLAQLSLWGYQVL